METDFTLIVILAAIIVPVVEIAGLLTAWHAVVRVRSSQGAIAWAISLITFPWLALPIFWVFGRNKFQGYVEALRKGQEQHAQSARAIINRLLEVDIVPRDDLMADLRVFENLAGMPFNQGNKVELLVDGPATFGAMFDSIETARNYILVQYFIIHDDELGRELRDILVRKAKAGVDVYFQYDEIGSHKLPKAYLRSLKQAGVHVNAFHTAKGRGNRFQLNFRNHRKITVVDGRTAFVGGHNIGDEYMGRDPRFGRWRDTHIKIHGPVIRQIQLSFVKDWYWSRGELIPLNWESADAEENSVHMLTLSTVPADELDICSMLFVQAINSAKTRFWLASPYFVPEDFSNSRIVKADEYFGLGVFTKLGVRIARLLSPLL